MLQRVGVDAAGAHNAQLPVCDRSVVSSTARRRAITYAPEDKSVCGIARAPLYLDLRKKKKTIRGSNSM